MNKSKVLEIISICCDEFHFKEIVLIDLYRKQIDYYKTMGLDGELAAADFNAKWRETGIGVEVVRKRVQYTYRVGYIFHIDDSS